MQTKVKSTFNELVNTAKNNTSYLNQLNDCRERLKNLTSLVRKEAANKAWATRKRCVNKTKKAQVSKTSTSKYSAAAQKAWATRRERLAQKTSCNS